MRKIYIISLIMLLFFPMTIHEGMEYHHSSPEDLIYFAEHGTVNRSLEIFFENVYLNSSIEEDFLRSHNYTLEKYKEGMMRTMGNIYHNITDFEILKKRIIGERAYIIHRIVLDGNLSYTGHTFFIRKNNRWYFDIENEINPKGKIYEEVTRQYPLQQ